MSRSLVIAAIYSPPRHAISSVEYEALLVQLGPHFLVAGDWNAKHTEWGSRLFSPKGKKVLNPMSGQFLPDLIRLTNILGFDGRSNDVVYCRPAGGVKKSNVCVFFGGDVQDFTENMLSHRDNKNHVEWNLENIAKLLQNSFIGSHIIVIRPLRMEYKTFSCYENFVPCTNCGVPEHTPLHNSLQHLQIIIHNISSRIRSMSDEEVNEAIQISERGLVQGSSTLHVKNTQTISERSSLNLDDCDITLIGFSKGCVVLNQFLYEFNYYKTSNEPNDLQIIPKIKEMYWLDGGHSGGKNTWINSTPLLETVAILGIKVHVHVTPYQINDERRPWIKKEEKLFSDTLKKLGVPIERTFHFENIPTTIQNHFKVLTVFRQTNNS